MQTHGHHASSSFEAHLPLFQIDSLSFVHNQQSILSGVSFNLQRDEWISIIGENGSGKTVLAKILKGDLKASSGTFKQNPLIKRIGLLTTEFQSIPYLSVQAHLEMAFSPSTQKRTDFLSALKSWTDYLQLPKELNVKAKDLSVNQLKKMNFVMQMLRQPNVLICDDYFTSMDRFFMKLVSEALISLQRKQGLSVIWLNSKKEEHTELSSKIYNLDKGKLIRSNL